MFKKIFWQTCNVLHNYIAKPRMIHGFKSKYTNQFLPNTRISNTTHITYPEKLNIADNVYVGHYGVLESSHGITIGEGCQISTYVLMTSHSSHQSLRLYGSHYIENNGKHIGYLTGSIIIGKYTFVGAFATIMPNTKIGAGSIVSAYSYVKGEFPDFAIIAGNPAIVVGDTRDLDREYLEKYSELALYYNEWANSINAKT